MAFTLLAGIHQAHGIGVDEPMEMDSAVLVELRDKDILEAVPPDLIIKPDIQFLRNGGHIIPVDGLRGQCKRYKEVKVITHGQVKQALPGPSGGPFEGVKLLSLPPIALCGRRFLGVPYLLGGLPVDARLPSILPALDMLAGEDRP